MTSLQQFIWRIVPVERSWLERAEARQEQLTKPTRSLGRLEEIANRLCGIQETLTPEVRRRRIVVFAADHGVAAEGVSAYPPDVTRQMVANFIRGGAAINSLASAAGADLRVVDVGVKGERIVADTGRRDAGVGVETRAVEFIDARVREGTRNMTRSRAMSELEMTAAVAVGMEMANAAARDGVQLVGLGEMGIGNTTAASAVTAALTGLPPRVVTGHGTGIGDEAFERKVRAIEIALAVNHLRAVRINAAWCNGVAAQIKDSASDASAAGALDVLCGVGGLEIAALCGLCVGAAAHRIAIVTDGFIATAAAALAVRLHKPIADYIFAAHISREPGHAPLLELVGARPLLELDMRLGEGSGAALAMPIIEAAARVFCEMHTFADAGVDEQA